jgi:hypothetical protein
VKDYLYEKGAALVEFALVAVLFFTILFSIIEFGYLFWGNLSMQHAVSEGSRYAVVTSASSFPSNPIDPTAQQKARCDAVIQSAKDNSMGFYSKVAPELTFTILDKDGNVDHVGSGPADCGSSEEIVTIRVNCSLPLITPFGHLLSLMGTDTFTDGKYHFSVSTTMRNEPS